MIPSTEWRIPDFPSKTRRHRGAVWQAARQSAFGQRRLTPQHLVGWRVLAVTTHTTKIRLPHFLTRGYRKAQCRISKETTARMGGNRIALARITRI